MTHDPGPDTHSTVWLCLAWIGTFLGALTLQQWVFVLTGVLTVLRLYVEIRDNLFRKRKEKRNGVD